MAHRAQRPAGARAGGANAGLARPHQARRARLVLRREPDRGHDVEQHAGAALYLAPAPARRGPRRIFVEYRTAEQESFYVGAGPRPPTRSGSAWARWRARRRPSPSSSPWCAWRGARARTLTTRSISRTELRRRGAVLVHRRRDVQQPARGPGLVSRAQARRRPGQPRGGRGQPLAARNGPAALAPPHPGCCRTRSACSARSWPRAARCSSSTKWCALVAGAARRPPGQLRRPARAARRGPRAGVAARQLRAGHAARRRPACHGDHMHALAAFLDRRFREYDFRRGAADAQLAARRSSASVCGGRPDGYYTPDKTPRWSPTCRPTRRWTTSRARATRSGRCGRCSRPPSTGASTRWRAR